MRPQVTEKLLCGRRGEGAFTDAKPRGRVARDHIDYTSRTNHTIHQVAI